MLLSNQQKYIISVLKQLKVMRVRQLHVMVQAHFRDQEDLRISEHRMDVMLRQMRVGSNFIFLKEDLVSYGKRDASANFLEAIDVMLELTENAPAIYSCDRLSEPFLLRFSGDGEMSSYLFSVAWLDFPGRIAATPRMKGERIVWISNTADAASVVLPRHHFFALRQEDGTHRFFGSTEPKKIQV